MGPDAIAEGFAALRAGDSAGARASFASADADAGAVLEGMARAEYLDHRYTQGADLWAAAYDAYRSEGDEIGAIRVARTLAFISGTILGDSAVMAGWFARAVTLLEGAEESQEGGWVELNRGMFEPDRRIKEERLRHALTIARTVGDSDLEFATLAYLGASLVMADRTDDGMMLLDEALAAVAGREVDDFTALLEIFCQLFEACEHAHDVDRADQWIRVGEEIAARRNLPAVSAFCRTHYGGVLTAAGRWAEADVALTEAVQLWGVDYPSLEQGARVRLADLRVRQGRYEEAEQLLVDLDVHVDAARPLAALHLARGRAQRAGDVVERALRELDHESVSACTLWALLVEVQLASALLDDASASAMRAERCAAQHPGPYLEAIAALARGRVALAMDSDDACDCLRDALAGFARAHTPLELAEARLELAGALASDRPEVAVAEARAAHEVFARLAAAGRADAASAMLRSLGERDPPGAKEAGVLTRRESEVLDLLGHGLSNPEIADRLFISRKTVEHHVSRILAKLGLRNRSEAAAFAAQERLPRNR